MTQNPALVQLTENANQIYQLISKQKNTSLLGKMPSIRRNYRYTIIRFIETSGFLSITWINSRERRPQNYG